MIYLLSIGVFIWERIAKLFVFFYLEQLATYLASIWEGMVFVFLFGGAGHLSNFYLGGGGFCFSIWRGWPLIYLIFGRGWPPIYFQFEAWTSWVAGRPSTSWVTGRP